jgi:ribosomal protein S13
MLAMQLELFPQATADEIKKTKSLLAGYRRMKAVVTEFERIGVENLAPKQKMAYNAYLKATQSVERAVRLILDDEVRRIVEMRYIKGERHKVTVLYFGNMHPATVARKLNEGIISVANSLKLLES